MGGCFSSSSTSSPSSSSPSSPSSTSLKHSTAKVLTLKGEVAEYKVPVIVSQVLAHQLQAQADQEEAPSWFLCSSDSLLFDDYIPALDLEDELEADQIYFVLPTSKLQYKLSASDMAALAVKASLALQNASTVIVHLNNSRRKINPPAAAARNRISPSPAPASSFDFQFHHQKPVSRANLGISRSASVRKFQRYTSRRAKLAVRSFRLRLATIFEGIVM